MGNAGKAQNVELLKTRRYVVEQFNGHVEENVLGGCWVRLRGIVKKAGMVLAGLAGIDANAIRAMVEGENSLKAVSQYWD